MLVKHISPYLFLLLPFFALSQQSSIVFYSDDEPYLLPLIQAELDSLKDKSTEQLIFDRVTNLSRVIESQQDDIILNEVLIDVLDSKTRLANDNLDIVKQKLEKALTTHQYFLKINIHPLNELIEYQFILYATKDLGIRKKNQKSVPVNIDILGMNSFIIDPRKEDYKAVIKREIRKLFPQSNIRPTAKLKVNTEKQEDHNYYFSIGDTIILDASESYDLDNPLKEIEYYWRQLNWMDDQQSIAREDSELPLLPNQSVQLFTLDKMGQFNIEFYAFDGIEKSDIIMISINIIPKISLSLAPKINTTNLNFIFVADTAEYTFSSFTNYKVEVGDSTINDFTFEVSPIVRKKRVKNAIASPVGADRVDFEKEEEYKHLHIDALYKNNPINFLLPKRDQYLVKAKYKGISSNEVLFTVKNRVAFSGHKLNYYTSLISFRDSSTSLGNSFVFDFLTYSGIYRRFSYEMGISPGFGRARSIKFDLSQLDPSLSGEVEGTYRVLALKFGGIGYFRINEKYQNHYFGNFQFGVNSVYIGSSTIEGEIVDEVKKQNPGVADDIINGIISESYAYIDETILIPYLGITLNAIPFRNSPIIFSVFAEANYNFKDRRLHPNVGIGCRLDIENIIWRFRNQSIY